MEARPDFLTDELLEKAINSKEEDTIKVVSSEITRATAPGDNFSSNIYRVSVQILRNGRTTPENLSLIVKVELQQTEMNKLTDKSNAFGTEIVAYTEILPKLRKLLEDAAPGKYPPYSAKCYYTHKGPPASFLIFEDLKAQGYTLALQSSMLDWNHCLLGIRTLAAYHAASVVMEKAEPDKFNIFRKAFFTENTRKELEIFFNPTIKKLAAEAENWPECKGYIAKALNELGDCAYDKLIECHKRNDEDFNVLNHSDSWFNNLMFRYSALKQPSDMRFVDFQVCQWTSPASDLLSFINSNAAIKVLENQNALIDEYYTTLCQTLTILGHGDLSPTKCHLYEQIEKRHKSGVISSIVIRAAVLADKDAKPNLEKVLKGEEESGSGFSEKFKSHIRSVLSIFHKKGWL